MISLIQLKQVLRNKRFFLFTVFIPATWYILLSNIQKGISPSIILGISVFIGIIGNSLATFSKRISSNIKFYSFESKFTNYSIKNFLVDQTIVQISLNSLIFLVVLVVALLSSEFTLSKSLLIQFLLLSAMGMYFSIIGFVLGVKLDAKIIDTVSFPIIILASITIMPFSSIGATGNFINIITHVQKIFPGYYYTNIINSIYSNQPVNTNDIYLFILIFILNIIPLCLLLPKEKLNSKR